MQKNSDCAGPRGPASRKLVVVAAVAPVAVVTAAAPALKVFKLLAQAFNLLLGQVIILFGLLKRGQDAVHVAQDGFEAVADAVDLAAQRAIRRTLVITVVAPVASAAMAFSAITSTLAPFIAAPVSFAFTFPALVALPTAAAFVAPRRFSIIIFRAFARFVEIFRGMIFGGCFRRAFALGQRLRNIVALLGRVFVMLGLFFAAIRFARFLAGRAVKVTASTRRRTTSAASTPASAPAAVAKTAIPAARVAFAFAGT